MVHAIEAVENEIDLIKRLLKLAREEYSTDIFVSLQEEIQIVRAVCAGASQSLGGQERILQKFDTHQRKLGLGN